MAKAIKTVLTLQIPAGQANPAPPVGPALGQHGLNIQEFCTRFNEATKDKTSYHRCVPDYIPRIISHYHINKNITRVNFFLNLKWQRVCFVLIL